MLELEIARLLCTASLVSYVTVFSGRQHRASVEQAAIANRLSDLLEDYQAEQMANLDRTKFELKN